MIMRDTFERKTKETIMKSGLQLLEKNPEKNIDNLFNLIKKGMIGQFAEDKINYIPSAELMIKDPIFMEKLDQLAEEFKPIADKAFEEDFNNTGNYDLSKG